MMVERFTQYDFHSICDHLGSIDPDLGAIIAAHGYPPFWSRPNTFETLAHIILEQQVSLASALAALNKLKEKLINLTPENILTLNDEEMRACYVSRQKMVYLRHLAEALVSGALNLHELEDKPDEEIRARLTALKGIGHWTTDIYLIFVLKHSDVFPIGDLAVVNAMKRAKKLPADTPREKLLEISLKWKPYRTIATMLLWHYYLSK